MKQKLLIAAKKTLHISKSSLWFLVGFSIAGITLLSIAVILFQNYYSTRTIPGVFIDNVYVGEKTEEEIKYIYEEKNKHIGDSNFTFSFNDKEATVTAEELNIGYDADLMANQASSLGKSANIFSNFFIITNAYLNGITLDSSYTFDGQKLEEQMEPFQEDAHKEPVNAEFDIQDTRVINFSQSENGRRLDTERVKNFVTERIPMIINSDEVEEYNYSLPTVAIEPEITTEEVNDYGIEEKIGEGESYFAGSIPNRIHNIGHAANKIDGTLVAPGEDFSFNQNVGDISSLTGYKEAYVISGGRTILGDGGGVCQVSTTLFRAMLNAGVPVTERHPHSYRVSYYEQQSPIGIDATIYVPTVDLKFKNDTGNHILIVADFSREESRLTFEFFGKSDGRQVEISDPVVLSRTPPPEPLYEDDPSLPVGVTEQVDYAAAGAHVQFNRTVTRNGEVLIDETYSTRYTPWQAVYKVGVEG